MAKLDKVTTQFMGQGLTFPIKLNIKGRPNIVSGKELLESSLSQILSWNLGTRFMLGEYGTKLEQLLQEPNDAIAQSLVKHYTVEVISLWEKRLEVLDVILLIKQDNLLSIQISYIVKSTKLEDSFVFPYYSQLKF